MQRNLTSDKRKVLHELSKCNLDKADKGGEVVVKDVKDVKETERQPSNKGYYKMLDSDPTETHTKLVEQTTDRFKRDESLKQTISEGLKNENSRKKKVSYYTRIS